MNSKQSSHTNSHTFDARTPSWECSSIRSFSSRVATSYWRSSSGIPHSPFHCFHLCSCSTSSSCYLDELCPDKQNTEQTHLPSCIYAPRYHSSTQSKNSSKLPKPNKPTTTQVCSPDFYWNSLSWEIASPPSRTSPERRHGVVFCCIHSTFLHAIYTEN